MKREWEMVEGEKKGRSSKEAKRSVFSTSCSHAHMLIYVHLLTCSYMLITHMFILKSTDMIIYAIMIEYANHIYMSSCFLQKEATGDSSSQLEGGECREGRKGRDWNGAEEVFYFSLVLHLSEEKEEDGMEQKSFSL